MSEYVLQMKDIRKSFSGVQVLKGISIQVKKGEILAICGENGAGKSTLMKVLSGFYPYGQYEGDIIVEDKNQHFSNTRDSAAAGIEIIYQELEVANNMTVAENIFMGHEPVRHGVVDKLKMIQDTRSILEELKIDIDPNIAVGKLGVGLQQMVVIAKSLVKHPKVLILDEPSAALTQVETDNLLTILEDLKKTGVACIYISHRLEEVMRIADTISVIRDGESIITDQKSHMTKELLIQYMVGRKLSEGFVHRTDRTGETVMKVSHLNAVNSGGRKILNDVSFELKKGEVLGIFGLMGAGRTETALAIMGVLNARTSGDIEVNGKKLDNSSPRKVIDSGINIVTEDRKEQGLVLDESIQNNMILASLDNVSQFGVIRQGQVVKVSNDYVKELNIKIENIRQIVGRLSGGNQQKVVIAKALMTEPKILILDEPTRGIDVGAKMEIYQIIDELSKQGMSVIMISSELPEVLSMSDRVLVMSQGKVTGILDNKDLTQELLMKYATEG